MHIVSAIAEGEAPEWGCDMFWQTGDAADLVLDKCITVFGVMFKLGESTPSFVSDILEAFSLEDGAKTPLEGSLDLNTVLPIDKNYYTYEGSLTTPPCTEGLRWHVFESPLTLTPADVERMNDAVSGTFDAENPEDKLLYRMNNRAIQPLNDRDVYYVNTETTSAEDDTPSTEDSMTSGVVAAFSVPSMLLALLAAVLVPAF